MNVTKVVLVLQFSNFILLVSVVMEFTLEFTDQWSNYNIEKWLVITGKLGSTKWLSNLVVG